MSFNHVRKRRIRITPEYDKKLLKLVKKGILIEVKPMNTSLLSKKPTFYKKSLGAVIKYNIFGRISHVYDIYEDFDGSIKYYDYPQNYSKPKTNLKNKTTMNGDEKNEL
jgi:hypothetical protein